MENIIILLIIAVLAVIGVVSARKHFRGEGGCCGGGGDYVPRKKLSQVIGKKTVTVEGMTCEHCKARVERAINDLDGLAAVVKLKKKQVQVSMARDASDEEIRAAIERAGYHVTGIH